MHKYGGPSRRLKQDGPPLRRCSLVSMASVLIVFPRFCQKTALPNYSPPPRCWCFGGFILGTYAALFFSCRFLVYIHTIRVCALSRSKTPDHLFFTGAKPRVLRTLRISCLSTYMWTTRFGERGVHIKVKRTGASRRWGTLFQSFTDKIVKWCA